MQRMTIDLVCLRKLHQLTQIHDTDFIGYITHHGKIVGDKKIRNPFFFLVILQKIDHLRLYGHIQGGNRLIADDQLRLEHQGTGNADSLPLSTGKFMCITAGMLFCQSDSFQHRINDLIRFVLFLYDPVGKQRFCDDIAHRHTCI